ncbi:MAG: hypothetical protein L3J93_02220 [Thermoplasmata archaeon]|nr:hypothetical protein [Thermoplasmata archaeon]
MEGEIWNGLLRLGLVPGAASAALAVASRTDRGVSARANALTLRSDLAGEDLLRALNGISPEIWFTRLARVPESFRPRSATERWYRYWERPARRVPPSWTEGAKLFQGEIDVRSFGRGVGAEAPSRRSIRAVEVGIRSGWLTVDIHARSFVWGMVRKIISALRAFESGALPIDRLRKAVEGTMRLPLPLAEPERLVLWEVTYPIPWELERPELARGQRKHVEAQRLFAEARAEMWNELVPLRKAARSWSRTTIARGASSAVTPGPGSP